MGLRRCVLVLVGLWCVCQLSALTNTHTHTLWPPGSFTVSSIATPPLTSSSANRLTTTTITTTTITTNTITTTKSEVAARNVQFVWSTCHNRCQCLKWPAFEWASGLLFGALLWSADEQLFSASSSLRSWCSLFSGVSEDRGCQHCHHHPLIMTTSAMSQVSARSSVPPVVKCHHFPFFSFSLSFSSILFYSLSLSLSHSSLIALSSPLGLVPPVLPVSGVSPVSPGPWSVQQSTCPLSFSLSLSLIYSEHVWCVQFASFSFIISLLYLILIFSRCHCKLLLCFLLLLLSFFLLLIYWLARSEANRHSRPSMHSQHSIPSKTPNTSTHPHTLTSPHTYTHKHFFTNHWPSAWVVPEPIRNVRHREKESPSEIQIDYHSFVFFMHSRHSLSLSHTSLFLTVFV